MDQDAVVAMCAGVAERAPEYGLGTLLPELLSAEAASWDATLIGLRALRAVLLAAPSCTASRFPSSLAAVGLPINFVANLCKSYLCVACSGT